MPNENYKKKRVIVVIALFLVASLVLRGLACSRKFYDSPTIRNELRGLEPSAVERILISIKQQDPNALQPLEFQLEWFLRSYFGQSLHNEITIWSNELGGPTVVVNKSYRCDGNRKRTIYVYGPDYKYVREGIPSQPIW